MYGDNWTVDIAHRTSVHLVDQPVLLPNVGRERLDVFLLLTATRL